MCKVKGVICHKITSTHVILVMHASHLYLRGALIITFKTHLYLRGVHAVATCAATAAATHNKKLGRETSLERATSAHTVLEL